MNVVIKATLTSLSLYLLTYSAAPVTSLENQPSSSSPKSTERSTPKSSKPNVCVTSDKTHEA